MFILGFICLTVISVNGLAVRPMLKEQNYTDKQTIFRKKLASTAQQYLGIREKTGRNDGPQIEQFLKVVNLKKGDPWCGAFISWLFHKMGRLKPRSGWTPDLFPNSRLTKLALTGNLIGIYFPEKKRIAHVGMIECLDGDWIIAIEGNTNLQGSREGDGVYRKRRHKRSVAKISDWVSQERKLP